VALVILAGFVLWLCGVLCGAALSGGILVLWLKQEPKRLGDIVRWIVEHLAEHNGGLYVKMYASLFDTRRASKCMVYVRPEDLGDAVGWYAHKLRPLPLQTKPGFASDTTSELDFGLSESEKDPGSER
jgi:hypothetical protein